MAGRGGQCEERGPRRAMRSRLQILGIFASFLFVIVGAVVLMGMNLELFSHPMVGDPSFRLYDLEFRGSPIFFYIGSAVVASGLTFLWAGRNRN